MGKLAREIRQNKPFASIEEEAILNIARTAEIFTQISAEFLKDFGPSPTQYNVLRILRGAGQDGLTCSQLSERMITHDPDITRLLDRMETRGWVVRARGNDDRRVVLTHISKLGLQLTNEIDQPLRAMVKKTLGKIGKGELSSLIDILEKIREVYK